MKVLEYLLHSTLSSNSSVLLTALHNNTNTGRQCFQPWQVSSYMEKNKLYRIKSKS